MSKALLPFYALYVGDGSTTVFTLDTSKDPFYFANDFVFASPTQTIPAKAALSSEFDHKLTPTNISFGTSPECSKWHRFWPGLCFHRPISNNFHPDNGPAEQHQV